jgi:hypothetical protein
LAAKATVENVAKIATNQLTLWCLLCLNQPASKFCFNIWYVHPLKPYPFPLQKFCFLFVFFVDFHINFLSVPSKGVIGCGF